MIALMRHYPLEHVQLPLPQAKVFLPLLISLSVIWQSVISIAKSSAVVRVVIRQEMIPV